LIIVEPPGSSGSRRDIQPDSVPAFNTGFNEDAILTSEGSAGAATVNVSRAASGVPDAPVASSATVRSPGCPSNSAAKSTPVKIASDAGVNAAATSRVTEPKGVVLSPTTQPEVSLKLSPAPRFEKTTPAFAGVAIPAIIIPIAILIGPPLGA
jgi:hypothetical protein